MASLLKIIVGIFIAWLFLRWLGANTNIFGAAYPPPDQGGSLLGGWPYAAPLPGPTHVRSWSPPYGSAWQSYFGFDWSPNSGQDIQFGYQGQQ